MPIKPPKCPMEAKLRLQSLIIHSMVEIGLLWSSTRSKIYFNAQITVNIGPFSLI
jgi:hypothetical protein